MKTNIIENKILNVLKKTDNWLSTYMIAKRIGSSWSTTVLHCYKLFYIKTIEKKVVEIKYQKNKTMWKIKQKN